MKFADATTADFPNFENKPLNPNLCEPRKINFQFNNIPKLWLNNNSALTHFFNAMNLFLPAFEGFMVRVMRNQLPRIQNTELEAPIRGFIKQEATHGQTHQKYNKILEAQGYKFKTALKIADFFFTEVLEKYLSPKMCLALIAGFENMTTIISYIVLKSNMLVTANPTMRSLWEWHAAEEIEHSGLAFKFLNYVDNRYRIRILGGLLGTVMVIGAIVVGMALLIMQDQSLTNQKTFHDLRKFLFTEYKFLPLTLKHLTPYFKLEFNPKSEDLYQYGEKVFLNI
ncbi:hypothetical protein DSM106972_030750 [Dulcicalothrix desertica PCC 7102]|uniref:Metal-dependent hydrolase n=1 Tax=Dulcicalothrix desertica PCC 7102 TaxID=232991 RepID=A0A3S1AQT4_9CYAN|nr:metal-dependent hydrolase [Dulcicalothrix desertica]RUT06818.1 hypothetical protein DSM106972_030750 [Dulcicalothrix desertica PCC 7102]TWH50073.1 hypothetical protein CAL7102_04355 [Dulcicalothrix desertica PCC 7102]